MSDKIIPKESLTAYQRWEMDSFGDAGHEQDAPQVQLPTAGEVEQIHRQAHDEGYAAGYREGRARAEQEAARLAAMAAGLDDALRQMEQRLAEDMLGLTLDISRQLLRQALQVKPESLLEVIRAALAGLPGSGQALEIRLNPEDAALLRETLADELAHASWRLIEDGRVSRGGCQIVSAGSEVDATVENRWRRLIAALGRDDLWGD